MYYLFNISTPPNTLESAPKISRLKIAKGTINQVKITFPKGCTGFHSCQIFRGGLQLYPFSIGEAFTGDGTSYDFSDYYLLTEQPYELTCHSWNNDDTLYHSVIVCFNISMAEDIQKEASTEEQLLKALNNLGLV